MSHEALIGSRGPTRQTRESVVSLLAYSLRRDNHDRRQAEEQRFSDLAAQISTQVDQLIPEGETEIRGIELPLKDVVAWYKVRGIGPRQFPVDWEVPTDSLALLGARRNSDDVEVLIKLYGEDSLSTDERRVLTPNATFSLEISQHEGRTRLHTPEYFIDYFHPNTPRADLNYDYTYTSHGAPTDRAAFTRRMFFEDLKRFSGFLTTALAPQNPQPATPQA